MFLICGYHGIHIGWPASPCFKLVLIWIQTHSKRSTFFTPLRTFYVFHVIVCIFMFITSLFILVIADVRMFFFYSCITLFQWLIYNLPCLFSFSYRSFLLLSFPLREDFSTFSFRIVLVLINSFCYISIAFLIRLGYKCDRVRDYLFNPFYYKHHRRFWATQHKFWGMWGILFISVIFSWQ